MVYVSHEVLAQTEARLRGVIERCEVDWLPGNWSFQEGEEAAAASDAIAQIRDDDRVSALIPSSSGAELFEVFRVVLPKGVDDSGFVGWFASRIKAETGSGLFVICGYDRRRGGIYDYYGVPAGTATRVREVVDALTREPTTLAGVVMQSASSVGNSFFGPDVLFCLDLHGDSLTARYGGGTIRQGLLTAALSAETSSTTFHFAHAGDDGPRSGHFEGTLRRDRSERWALTLLAGESSESSGPAQLVMSQLIRGVA